MSEIDNIRIHSNQTYKIQNVNPIVPANKDKSEEQRREERKESFKDILKKSSKTNM